MKFTDTRWCPSGVSRRDVDAGVDVRVAGKAAGDAAEPGLAAARVLVDPSAGTAAQTGVSSSDSLHPTWRLVLRAPNQEAPSLSQDRPVQARLGCYVLTWSLSCPSCRPGHVLYSQVLETDQVELPRQAGRDLLAPVLTPVSLAGAKPLHMQGEGEASDAESLSQVALTATRTAMGASVEVPHRLAEVPQSLLLHILRPCREPCLLRTRFCEHPRLLHTARQWPHRPPFLADALTPTSVFMSRCFPVGLQSAELVQVPGQIPHVPGVRAILTQDSFLRRRRVQPEPRHAVRLVGTTDIPGRRQRGPTCRLKTAALSARF